VADGELKDGAVGGERERERESGRGLGGSPEGNTCER